MGSMKDRGDFINVYHLVPPDAIVEQQDVIARTFFGMRSANDGSRTLSVSPVSGCLTYTDTARLWQSTNTAGLPNNERDARNIAETWLRNAYKRLTTSRSQAPASLSQLLPTQLQHVRSRAVYAPGRSFVDHWLSLFATTLGTGLSASDAAPVDAMIELRMGPNQQAIGMVSTWRPFDAVKQVPHIAFAGGPFPFLFYRMAASEEPQTFIAPYYVTTSGDQGHFWPASSYSLLIDIAKEYTPAGAQLSAITAGSAGRKGFGYAWGFWRLDALESGFQALSGAQSVRLKGPGIYNVVLDVEDLEIGVVARTQSILYLPSPQEQLVA